MLYQYWYLLSPRYFMWWSNYLIMFLRMLSWPLLICGLLMGLYLSPSDGVQGETYRIIYVHVPCAWMCLFLYGVGTMASALYFITRHPFYGEFIHIALKFGSIFTFITLVTGSFWGVPMWGTYWAWDARMTSVLVLFLFYVAGLVLYVVIPVPSKRFLMISISTMIGFVNIPIVKYSVNWWYTLHQPSTISLKNVHIDTSMLVPLLVMFLFVNIYALKLILTDLRQYVISKRILKHKSIS